jgi:hypothetical protein
MTTDTPALIGHSTADGPKIDRFQIYGERRSGTNFVARTIARNTGLKRFSSYGWKHALPYFPLLPKCCLFVVVVREPFDWLRSFYAGPFEVDPAIANLPFSDFLRAEWEGRYTGFSEQWAYRGYAVKNRFDAGAPNFLDRHPLTGRRFANVCEMRSVKLAGHLSLLDRGLNTVAVRYEDFRNQPEAMLAAIAEATGITLAQTFRPTDKPVGPSSDARSAAKTALISDADRAFILQNLDPAPELRCGYLANAAPPVAPQPATPAADQRPSAPAKTARGTAAGVPKPAAVAKPASVKATTATPSPTTRRAASQARAASVASAAPEPKPAKSGPAKSKPTRSTT